MVIMVKESAGIDCIDKDIANNISVEIIECLNSGNKCLLDLDGVETATCDFITAILEPVYEQFNLKIIGQLLRIRQGSRPEDDWLYIKTQYVIAAIKEFGANPNRYREAAEQMIAKGN